MIPFHVAFGGGGVWRPNGWGGMSRCNWSLKCLRCYTTCGLISHNDPSFANLQADNSPYPHRWQIVRDITSRTGEWTAEGYCENCRIFEAREQQAQARRREEQQERQRQQQRQRQAEMQAMIEAQQEEIQRQRAAMERAQRERDEADQARRQEAEQRHLADLAEQQRLAKEAEDAALEIRQEQENEAARAQDEQHRDMAIASQLRERTTTDGGEPVEVSLGFLQRSTDDFNEGRKVGEGAFGAVYHAFADCGFNDPAAPAATAAATLLRSASHNYVHFAVKRIQGDIQLRGNDGDGNVDSGSTARREATFEREIQFLRTFKHRHVVRLLGYCSAGDQRFLLYEFAAQGSLAGQLRQDDTAARLSWRARLRFAVQIASALCYLHANQAFHKDVKASNICINGSGEALLIDCGLASIVAPDAAAQATGGGQSVYGPTTMGDNWGCVGTRGYMCPTYMQSLRYGSRSEVFSFGVVLLELLTGRVQEGSPPDFNLYLKYIENEDPPLREALDPRLVEDPWPLHVAEPLCRIAEACLLRHKDRSHMQTVMRRLTALGTQFAVPTQAEERVCALQQQLIRLELLETARRDVEDAAHARGARIAAARQRSCMICFDDFDSAEGLECLGTPRHFLCAGCLTNYVGHKTQESRGQIFARHNHINCPVQGCSMSDPGHDAFPAATIGGHVPSAVFGAHVMNLARMERWRQERLTGPTLEAQEQALSDQAAQIDILHRMVDDAAAAHATAMAESEEAAAVAAAARAASAEDAAEREELEVRAQAARQAAAHAAATAATARAAAAAAAAAEPSRDQNYKICPQCGLGIERISGCDHITCPCGHEFCYVCLAPGIDAMCPGQGILHTQRHPSRHR